MIARPAQQSCFLFRIIGDEYVVAFFGTNWWPAIADTNNDIDKKFRDNQIGACSNRAECFKLAELNHQMHIPFRVYTSTGGVLCYNTGETREVCRMTSREEAHYQQFVW